MQRYLIAITEADIDAILAIEEHSFERPWERLSFLNELSCKDAINFAVKYNDFNGHEQIIAYIYFRLVDAEMHILKIAVAPKWRCQGVATWLMNKSLALAEENDTRMAYLEVRPSNNLAIKLYTKLGFEAIAKRPNYYSETSEDALVMSKNYVPLNNMQL
ncbi:ribosomal protein S18-alanine N-acetyltransferase [Thermodesulfobacteriota bacterium]